MSLLIICASVIICMKVCMLGGYEDELGAEAS